MIIPAKIAQFPVIWELRKMSLYMIMIIKAVIKFKRISLIYNSILDFPIWWKYLQRKNDPLKNDFPWITFRAEKFLQTILKKDMIVFEYGAGSSTLYFAKRVNQVFSIEHDINWFEQIQQTFDKQSINNIICQLIEPEFLDKNITSEYISMHNLYKNKSFESYVKSIEVFPDEKFDVVMIDGRARTSCIKLAKNKIKKGGYLIVDNSERKYYFNGNDYILNANEWKPKHFIGPIPYFFHISKTSFYQKI